MNKFDPTNYTITIKKELIDNEHLFVGRAMELPLACVYETSYTKAYKALISIIEDMKNSANEDQEDFPLPFTNNEYSGRVTLRLPKELHRQVDFLAITNECSLNTFILTAISEYIGRKTVISNPLIVNNQTTTTIVYPYINQLNVSQNRIGIKIRPAGMESYQTINPQMETIR